jgi:AraC-like DNA-binding protein/quercetin dioxygenase-like cupin family protein
MSKKRHDNKFDSVAVPGTSVTTFHHDYPDGSVFREHYHDMDQIIFACSGVMTVHTSRGMWIIPTHRALWIPAGTLHSVRNTGQVSTRTLYFTPKLARKLPRFCCVLTVSPLLRELILHACQYPTLSRRSKEHLHTIELVLKLLHSSPLLPLQLPQPSDPRAARVANVFLKEPGISQTINDVCRQAGACKRTIERIFRTETGMTLGRWRQQLRLIHSLQLLAQGVKINNVALEVGYSSPSSYCSMFKNALGTTPRLYFRNSSPVQSGAVV